MSPEPPRLDDGKPDDVLIKRLQELTVDHPPLAIAIAAVYLAGGLQAFTDYLAITGRDLGRFEPLRSLPRYPNDEDRRRLRAERIEAGEPMPWIDGTTTEENPDA